MWAIRREARKPGSYFWLKGGNRPAATGRPTAVRQSSRSTRPRRRARRTVHPAAAAAVHHRLRDPGLGNGIRRCAAGQLSAVGGRRPRDGARHQVVSGRSWSPVRRSTRCGPVPAAARSTSGRGCPSRCCSTTEDPSTDVVLAESVSMAMLVLLETLSPDERAVFVLREVFGFDYDEIAARSANPAPTVRQIAHRAREHVQARRKRFDPVDPQRNAEITAQFLATAASGDVDALMAMLAPDAIWTADSGGKASAARRPVVGAEQGGRAHHRPDPAGPVPDVRVEPAICNSAPALVLYLGDQPGGRVHASRSPTARSPTSTRCATPTSWPPWRPPATSAAAEPGRAAQIHAFCQARAVRIERLGDLGEAPRVLRAVGAATGRLGLPPPAALTGDWFGALAVIAPSLAVAAGRPPPTPSTSGRLAAPSRAVGGGWFGYLSYPDAGADGRGPRIPEAAGGWTDCVLRRDRDGTVVVRKPFRCADAGLADRRAGRGAGARRATAGSTGTAPTARHTAAGCWPAWTRSRAGEVYQACVCTQFTGTVDRLPAGLLRRRRRADVAGAGGLCRRAVGCGGVAVPGTVPAPPRRRS